MDFTDGVTTTTSAYSTYHVKGPVTDGYGYGSGTVGLSAPSGVFTSDTININPQLQTAGNHSVLAGFIITDQPVVTHSAPASTVLPVGGSFVLSASVLGINTLSYQWQHAGTNIPGATFPELHEQFRDDCRLRQLSDHCHRQPVPLQPGHRQCPRGHRGPAARGADRHVGCEYVHHRRAGWFRHVELRLANWWSGSADDYWGAPDSAIFGVGGAGPYTVTLGDNITANGDHVQQRRLHHYQQLRPKSDP